MIKIMLVDDHDLVRTGIKLLVQDIPDVQIVGETSCAEDVAKIAREAKPDVVLMDVNMPGIGGLEATRRLLRVNSDIKVLIVSAYATDFFPARLLQAGAAGYLTKKSSKEEMAQAIQSVYAGECYISPLITNQLVLARLTASEASPFNDLSERELQILLMIARGINPKNIAKQLHLSAKTVNSYRHTIFKKLAVTTDVELALVAIREGLIDIDNQWN